MQYARAMKCPRCNSSTVTLQTRPRYKAGHWKNYRDPTDLDVRRRRRCAACGFRFTTYESVDMTQREYLEAILHAADPSQG